MISDKTLARAEDIDFDAVINSKEPGELIQYIAMHAMDLEGDKFGPAAITYYNKLTGNNIINDPNAMAIVFIIIAIKEKETNLMLRMLAALYQLTEWEKEDEATGI